MDERPIPTAPGAQKVPHVPPGERPVFDRPPAVWGAPRESLVAHAGLTPEERAAAYLNSIRRMMVFLTAVVAVGLIAGVILAVIDLSTLYSIHQSQLPSSPFGG